MLAWHNNNDDPDDLGVTIWKEKRAKLPRGVCYEDTFDAWKMCAEAERMPGINVDHWPWQGHSLNLRKRGFSGDWMLGPYGWSGQNKK